jgi:hypothetical protein
MLFVSIAYSLSRKTSTTCSKFVEQTLPKYYFCVTTIAKAIKSTATMFIQPSVRSDEQLTKSFTSKVSSFNFNHIKYVLC